MIFQDFRIPFYHLSIILSFTDSVEAIVVGIETKFWYTIINNYYSRMFYSNINMLLFLQLLKIQHEK